VRIWTNEAAKRPLLCRADSAQRRNNRAPRPLNCAFNCSATAHRACSYRSGPSLEVTYDPAHDRDADPARSGVKERERERGVPRAADNAPRRALAADAASTCDPRRCDRARLIIKMLHASSQVTSKPSSSRDDERAVSS
jgi:hypothetical protein